MSRSRNDRRRPAKNAVANQPLSPKVSRRSDGLSRLARLRFLTAIRRGGLSPVAAAEAGGLDKVRVRDELRDDVAFALEYFAAIADGRGCYSGGVADRVALLVDLAYVLDLPIDACQRVADAFRPTEAQCA